MRRWSAVTWLGAALLLAGCGSSTATAPPSKARASATPRPSLTPAPAPPQGPFAAVVTNASRQGTGYQVLIIDTRGTVVAQVSAQLPHVKASQTVDLPLVS